MEIRVYDRARDFDALLRVHADVGWSDGTDRGRRATDLLLGQGSTLVGLVDGRAESFASNHDGVMQYLDQELPLIVVGGVATSHLARRGGGASRLTAEVIARDVIEKNAAVAVLGVFDHGFYDRLGFGPGAYDHIVGIDPAALRVPPLRRAPVRLSVDDAQRVHANRLERPLRHGAIRVSDPGQTHADMLSTKHPLGLGFEDEAGMLTHHVWIHTEVGGGAPWFVRWMGFQDPLQVIELLSLLKGTADQIPSVRLIEPPDILIWDLLDRPWRRQNLTQGSKLESFVRASAWWAARICDLPACLEAVRLPVSEPLAFNLLLDDPIGAYLSSETTTRWSGAGGEYVVTLGSSSSAVRGSDDTLPTMRASVGTFTRLWLGVQHAAGLALTSPDLDAPAELIRAIDRIWRLPVPNLYWDI